MAFTSLVLLAWLLLGLSKLPHAKAGLYNECLVSNYADCDPDPETASGCSNNDWIPAVNPDYNWAQDFRGSLIADAESDWESCFLGCDSPDYECREACNAALCDSVHDANEGYCDTMYQVPCACPAGGGGGTARLSRKRTLGGLVSDTDLQRRDPGDTPQDCEASADLACDRDKNDCLNTQIDHAPFCLNYYADPRLAKKADVKCAAYNRAVGYLCEDARINCYAIAHEDCKCAELYKRKKLKRRAIPKMKKPNLWKRDGTDPCSAALVAFQSVSYVALDYQNMVHLSTSPGFLYIGRRGIFDWQQVFSAFLDNCNSSSPDPYVLSFMPSNTTVTSTSLLSSTSASSAFLPTSQTSKMLSTSSSATATSTLSQSTFSTSISTSPSPSATGKSLNAACGSDYECSSLYCVSKCTDSSTSGPKIAVPGHCHTDYNCGSSALCFGSGTPHSSDSFVCVRTNTTLTSTKCSSDAGCPSGAGCRSGFCHQYKQSYDPCLMSSDCASGNCVAGSFTCSAASASTAGSSTFASVSSSSTSPSLTSTPTSTSKTTSFTATTSTKSTTSSSPGPLPTVTGLKNGAVCAVDSACSSAWCMNGKCADSSTSGPKVAVPGHCHTDYNCGSAALCYGNGQPNSSDSFVCVKTNSTITSTKCTSPSNCPKSAGCRSGSCYPFKNPNDPCLVDSDCSSGACPSPALVCAPASTSTSVSTSSSSTKAPTTTQTSNSFQEKLPQRLHLLPLPLQLQMGSHAPRIMLVHLSGA